MAVPLRMRIAGMTCADCEARVVRALEGAGASDASADSRRGEARLLAPEGVDWDALRAAVAAAGYRPLALEPVGAWSAAGRTGAVPTEAGSAAYDLAIVGSGGAAFSAAIRARDAGARVVMVERGTIGGTCVNVGCVPSKTLLRAAEVYHLAGHPPFAGIATEAGAVDMGRLMEQKNALVEGLRQHKYVELAADYGFEIVRGEAAFVDPRAIEVGGRRIEARAFLIASGARPAVPDIPGLAEAGYLTSTTALELDRVPARVAVIGSGRVALELGQLLRRLGAGVTLLRRSRRLLQACDPEIAAAMDGALEDMGIERIGGVCYRRVEGHAGGRRIHIEVDGGGRVVEADEILVAAGRRPNTEALRLERAGVALGDRGQIPVDAELRTNVPHILAAGDVTAGPQFVYVAAHQGGVAADNALGAHRRVDLRVVPAVTFTTPALATVGLTEAEARRAGHAVKTSVLPLAAVPRALVNRDTRGVFKIVADAANDRVLGVHMVADGAGDTIYAATLAVRFQLTVADLVETMVPYLTMAEGLRLAAQTFGRDVKRLSCCAG